jgi:pimeloyl-ACP methyl ester carboxylesterase
MLYPLLRRINDHLVRWAMRKFKRLRRREKRARLFLVSVARRSPGLFAHWRFGLKPDGWTMGAVCGPSVPGAPWLFAKMATPHGFRDNAMAMMAGSMNGGQSRARTDDVGRLFQGTLAVSGRGYLYQLAGAAAGWTSLPFLRPIPQPVLVMGGEHDPIIPVTNARILDALIPNSTLQVYPGGHVEPHTAATDFAQRISEFLTHPGP